MPEVAATLVAGGHGRGREDDRNVVADVALGLSGRGSRYDGTVETLVPEDGPLAFDRVQITSPDNRSRPRPGGPAPAVGVEPSLLAFNIYPAGGQGADLEASATELASSLGAVALGRSTDRGTRIVQEPGAGVDAPSSERSGFAGQAVLSFDGALEGTATRRRPVGARVRRLTPSECERLQGFPVGWTDVDFESGEVRDGRRYKALGNSIAVPVLRWIGERIAQVDRMGGE